MQGIGDILKKTRETKGITLQEVSEATKIRLKYLEAIEHEEFQLLPGEIYARGFVTTYLKYLGIKDQPEVLAIMQKKVEAPPVPTHVETEQEKERQTRLSRKAAQPKKRSTGKKTPAASFEEKPLSKKSSLIIILSVVAIILLLALQWFYTKSQQEEVPQDTVKQEDVQNDETEQNPAEEQPPTEPEPVTPPEPVYTGLEMKLEILDVNADKADQCWMQIVADGQTTETTMSEGQTQDIQAAQSIQLNLGNAGVVKVTINGQDLGTLGTQGQVVRKEFKLEDYVTTGQ